MQVENIPIEQVLPYARNPRKNDAAVAGVAASIKEFGFQNPIIIDKENSVIAGHTRLLAARQLKLKEVPCLRAEKLTKAQVKAYRLLDNKLAERAEWDDTLLREELVDLEELGFDLDPYDVDFDNDIGPEEVNTEDDEVPEAPKDAFSKLGDVWLCGKHRVMCGDSCSKEDFEKLVINGAPILMVTDPPYGVEYDPNWRNEAAEAGFINYAARSVGTVSNDERCDWSDAYSLFTGSVVYVWHADRHARTVQENLEACGFVIINQIIWAKPMFAISRGDYHWQHEPCWYAVRKNSNHNWQGSRSESTLWSIERGCKEKTGHGTEKPIECMLRPIQNNTEKGEACYDPFLGSGTTLVAAERLNRICYGMEIEPRYVDVICQRFYNETKQVPVRESDLVPFPVEVADGK